MVPKHFLAKGTPNFINGYANLTNKASRNLRDQMILDNCALLSFVSVDILAIAFF